MSETEVEIEFVKGNKAPRYPADVCERQLSLDRVVITEKGTQSALPIVDFQMRDTEGRLHFFAVTGRIVNIIAVAIRGVNMRNHGVEEP